MFKIIGYCLKKSEFENSVEIGLKTRHREGSGAMQLLCSSHNPNGLLHNSLLGLLLQAQSFEDWAAQQQPNPKGLDGHLLHLTLSVRSRSLQSPSPSHSTSAYATSSIHKCKLPLEDHTPLFPPSFFDMRDGTLTSNDDLKSINV
ncbi:hypothetical protein BUALT_Bualt13G0015800 [Buddleja alternifolia]|uniref:Uncharacterized protein n=1 Tax=Buddleja alternifolia TaxID=168488 RepID=A0AAV6WUX3_9LAMI|nr:hypothetical protein BUALT_Bualt13G0015800 [Buddleja alternifolia]